MDEYQYVTCFSDSLLQTAKPFPNTLQPQRRLGLLYVGVQILFRQDFSGVLILAMPFLRIRVPG